MKIKIRLTFLIFFFVLIIGQSVFASNVEDYNSLRNAIDRVNPTKYLGQEGKASIIGLAVDLIDIIRYVSVTALVIKLYLTFKDIKDVNEDPKKLSKLKNRFIYVSLGMVFLGNFWEIYEYLIAIAKKIRI